MLFRKFLFFISLAIIFLKPSVSLAEMKKIAVLDFQGVELEYEIEKQLTEQAIRAASRFQIGEFQVMEQEDVFRMIRSKHREPICIDEQCALSLGKDLGADFVITGNIIKSDETYLILLKLFDIQSGSTLDLRRVEAKMISDLEKKAYRRSRSLLRKGILGEEAIFRGRKETTVEIGYLSIDSQSQTGVSAFLDGTKIGVLPIKNIEIEAGRHTLNLKSECFEVDPLEFQVEAGKKQEVGELEITPKTSKLNVLAFDSNKESVQATVFLDGEELGKSPLNMEVPVCSQEIKVDFNKEIRIMTLSLEEDRTTVVNFQSLDIPEQPIRFKDVYPLVEDYSQEAQEKRLESIKMVKRMLKHGSFSAEVGGKLWFRLAQLYSQEGHYLYFQENQEYQKRYSGCMLGIPEGCKVESLQLDHSNSTKWQEDAIKRYNYILEKRSSYSRQDEVLYYLGLAYLEKQEPEKAFEQFARVISEYSDSEYVLSAHIQFGERYFEHGEMELALQEYEKAVQYKGALHYDFAVYKLAWCYYRLGKKEEAVENMKAVKVLETGNFQAKVSNDLRYFLANSESIQELE